MKKRIILCIFLLLVVSCGGEKNEEEVEIYNVIGIWEVSPTINCKEYDCQERDCSEAGISSKYSMTIERSEGKLEALFHCDGKVDSYVLERKINNTYTIYDFHDGGSYINIYELAITFNSNNLFTGEEVWRLINASGCCKKVDNLIGERVR